MYGYADKNYKHAKIYALQNLLLKKNEYLDLIHSADFSPLSSEPFRENEIKKPLSLKESVFRKQIEKIIRMIESGHYYRDYFVRFLRKYELENIKFIFSRLYGFNDIHVNWYDISPYNSIGHEIFSGDITWNDLRDQFSGTFFSSLFDYVSLPDYQVLDMRTDFLIFELIYDIPEKLTVKQRNIYNEICVKRAATIKTVWYYRLRYFYGWNQERIKSYLSVFDEQIITTGRSSNLLEETEREVAADIKHKFTDSVDKIDSYLYKIERFVENRFFQYVSGIFFRDFFSVYPVVSYLWQLSYQIENLFRIIDGKKFKLSSEKIYDSMYIRH